MCSKKLISQIKTKIQFAITRWKQIKLHLTAPQSSQFSISILSPMQRMCVHHGISIHRMVQDYKTARDGRWHLPWHRPSIENKNIVDMSPAGTPSHLSLRSAWPRVLPPLNLFWLKCACTHRDNVFELQQSISLHSTESRYGNCSPIVSILLLSTCINK